jgi:hypothetical protein
MSKECKSKVLSDDDTTIKSSSIHDYAKKITEKLNQHTQMSTHQCTPCPVQTPCLPCPIQKPCPPEKECPSCPPEKICNVCPPEKKCQPVVNNSNQTIAHHLTILLFIIVVLIVLVVVFIDDTPNKHQSQMTPSTDLSYDIQV